MVRRVRGQQGHECCFFPAGGIKVGGRCTGRAELGPQRQPRAAAASSSPTSSCWMRGCGHWEVASSVFPSNKLFLESVGCKPQPQILLSCIFFFPKARPLSVWRCVGKRQEASRGGLVSGLWAGSAWLPPLPAWALGTIPHPETPSLSCVRVPIPQQP